MHSDNAVAYRSTSKIMNTGLYKYDFTFSPLAFLDARTLNHIPLYTLLYWIDAGNYRHIFWYNFLMETVRTEILRHFQFTPFTSQNGGRILGKYVSTMLRQNAREHTISLAYVIDDERLYWAEFTRRMRASSFKNLTLFDFFVFPTVKKHIQRCMSLYCSN